MTDFEPKEDDMVFFEGDDELTIEVFQHQNEDEEDVIETKHNYSNRIPHPFTNQSIRDKIAKEFGNKYKNEKNGTILEKHVYNTTIMLCRLRNIPLKATDKNFQLVYASVAYEVLASQEGIKDVIERLKSGMVEWKSPVYRDLIEARLTEEADHSQDVVEGIHECNDCKNAGRVYKKTRNIQIQTRSGDEGMTVFVTCATCRKMWRQNN